MAPELLQGQQVAASPGLDTWSIGMMWYAMLYGTLPFFADKEEALIEKIKKAPLKFDKNIPVTEECENAWKIKLQYLALN